MQVIHISAPSAGAPSGAKGLDRMLFMNRAGTSVVALGASAVLALAMNTTGAPTRHLTLDDGGVWVSSDANHSWGRLNAPVGQLDAALVPPTGDGTSLDVLQDGPSVAVWDKGSGALYAVDPALRTLTGQPVAVPATAQAGFAGGTVAVLSPDGQLRGAHADSGIPDLSALGPSGRALTTKLPKGSAMAVTQSGTVLVASPRMLLEFPPIGSSLGAPVKVPLDTAKDAALQVTAVGDQPVVLDVAAGNVLFPSSKRSVLVKTDQATATLQQAGPANADVYLADSHSLVAVPLSAGGARVISDAGAGVPAQPAVLGACVHIAWAGSSPKYVRACDGTAGPTRNFVGTAATPPAFRVNREQVVLNDVVSGAVYVAASDLVAADKLWDRIRPSDNNVQTQTTNKPDRRNGNQKPTPKDDSYGVRAGVPAILHVLDNDSDPNGDLLALTDVSSSGIDGATVVISQDRQSLIAMLPAGSASARVTYTVSDGSATAQANVTIALHAPGQNSAPVLRLGYQAPAIAVAAGGSVQFPVLPDWRDPDGDPMYVSSATAPLGFAVPSGDGIAYTASVAAGIVPLTYAVGDGMKDGDKQKLNVKVLDVSSSAVPAVARPDVAQGTVGQPLVIFPLENDLPGADPSDRSAKLVIASPVTSKAGVEVTTDLGRGSVTVLAKHPGVVNLTYQAGFGSAAPSQAAIRVDIRPDAGKPGAPVAAPDTLVVHGQQAGIVDVVSNDFDPQGGVLVVQDATCKDGDLLLSVIDGSALRVSSSSGQPGLHTVQYRVSNGAATSVGVLSVIVKAPTAANNPPVAVDDIATVRSGDVVSIPVLGNDSDPDGDPISLAPVPPTMAPIVQQAGVALNGDRVMFAAPPGMTRPTQTVVSYYVQDARGARTTGHISVAIVPLGTVQNDQPPTPQDLEGRLTAGDTLTLHVPVNGIDPDGDTATLSGITQAPLFGRIVAMGADTITYQSYPLASGTDQFTYQVADRFGLTGTARVRVGIVPPGLPGAPVAVNDDLVAAPGRTVHVDVMANDSVPSGSTGTVLPLTQSNKRLAAGVVLTGSVITATVPAAGSGPLRVAYALSSGVGDPATAFFTVTPVAGATIAPVARNDLAGGVNPATGKILTVDVLANDDDPDGSRKDLTVARAFAPDVKVVDGKLLVPVLAVARSVAYEISDADGLTAIAVVQVAGGNHAVPYLKAGKRVMVAAKGAAALAFSDYVESPRGKAIRITTTDFLASSPAGALSINPSGVNGLTVTSASSYTGPGSVTFQVTDGATVGDPDGRLALITVPVQIGPDAPALRCPKDALQIVEGGTSYTADVMSLCHVWIDPTAPKFTVKFQAVVTPASGKVHASVDKNTSLALSADAGAAPGSIGGVHLSVQGTPATADLTFQVVKAPPLTLAPVTVPGLIADRPAIIDFTQFATSRLRGGQITVVTASQASGAPVAVAVKGSSVTLTPGHDTHGAVSFAFAVTDVPNRADRTVRTTVSTDVQSHPDTPSAPTVLAQENKQVAIAWPAPAANGSPILGYTVTGGPRPFACPASPCTITGLTNNTSYIFRVVATNAVGPSAAGPPSASATPDTVPGAVTDLALTPGDKTIDARWSVPSSPDFSPVTQFQVELHPGATTTITPGQIPLTLRGLTNGSAYSLRVRAINHCPLKSGCFGPWSAAVSAVPFGTPATPAPPAAVGAATVAGDKSRAITVSWSEPSGAGNGRGITSYLVTEYSATSQSGAYAASGRSHPVAGTGTGGYSTLFDVKNDGTYYVYTLKATNAGALTSPESGRNTPPVQGTAPPDQMAAPVAMDHDGPGTSGPGYDRTIHVSYRVPAANSTSLDRIEYRLNGGPTQAWSSPAPEGTTESKTISGLSNGTAYTIALRGCNSAGQCGPWSASSNSVTPYGVPGAPIVTATVSGQDMVYAWSGGGGNGRDVSTYTVCIDGVCLPQSDTTSPGSTTRHYGYYSNYTITVKVTDAANQDSGATTKAGKTPQAPPPNAPNVGAVASGNHVDYSWSGGGGYRPITYNVCIDGTCQGGQGAGSTSRDYGYSYTWRITVSAVDDAGQSTSAPEQSGTTPPPPPPPVSASITATDSNVAGPAGGSSWMNFQVHNFPTGTYGWSCEDQAGKVTTPPYTFRISDPNQSFNATTSSSTHFCYESASPAQQRIVINGVRSNFTG